MSNCQKGKEMLVGDRALKCSTKRRHIEIVHSTQDGRARLVYSHVMEREHTGALNRLSVQRWSQQDKLCAEVIITLAFPLSSSWK